MPRRVLLRLVAMRHVDLSQISCDGVNRYGMIRALLWNAPLDLMVNRWVSRGRQEFHSIATPPNPDNREHE